MKFIGKKIPSILLSNTEKIDLISFCELKDIGYICNRFETAGEVRVCFMAII